MFASSGSCGAAGDLEASTRAMQAAWTVGMAALDDLMLDRNVQRSGWIGKLGIGNPRRPSSIAFHMSSGRVTMERPVMRLAMVWEAHSLLSTSSGALRTAATSRFSRL